MPKKRKKISKTKIELNQLSQMSKRRKNASETKNVKIDESSSANQETPTTSQDTKKKCLMDTGAHDFKNIRWMPAFVDKTMLMKTIMETVSQVLLVAPRRFGKTINLSMIKRFLEVLPDKEALSENRNLFIGTKIEDKCPDIINSHCGKYPVILLDFKCSGSRVNSIGSVLEFLRDVAHKAYKRHSYLQSSDKLNGSQKMDVAEWCDNRKYKSLAATPSNIESGLENLAEYLAKHFGQKVIVLVDEYDCVCSNSIIYITDIEEEEKLPNGRNHRKGVDEIRDIIALCMGAIGCLLKSNDYVLRGVLTGISYLATIGLSALINVEVMKFQEQHDFTGFYGITSEELKEVLSRKDVLMNSKYDEIMKNYNGYRGNMLNTWSVMNYLNNGENRDDINYWTQSGIVAGLNEAMKLPAVRSIIIKLLSSISNLYEIDQITKMEYEHILNLKEILDGKNLHVFNVNIFFNFILEQGYLKITDLNVSKRKINVEIPNDEIRSEFREKLKLFYSAPDFDLNFTEVEKCAGMLDKLNTSNTNNQKVLKNISKSLNKMFSRITLDVQNEATLHHLIFIVIFFSKKFRCFSEIRVAIKDPKILDLLLLSKNLSFGIIIELKYKCTAIEGLKQIITNRYYNAFKNPKYNPDNLKIQHYLLLGINMCENKNITLCSLFDCQTLKKCVYY